MLRRATVIFGLLILASPGAVASPTGAFADRVIAAESSGNPQARPRNPETGKLRSSAFGAGQFVEATWLDMVRRYRSDLGAKTDKDILELRGDIALSREMTIRLAKENQSYLLREGLKPTRAALYLAHFAGARGAANLLKADPDSAVEDILSPHAIEANPFLRGKNVAALYSWATAKMSVEGGNASSRVALVYNGDGNPQDFVLARDQRTPESRVLETISNVTSQVSALRQVRVIRGGVVEVVFIN